MSDSSPLGDPEAALLSLTPAQALAVEALVAGKSHGEAAVIAMVSRETVSRWAEQHPAFKAALNAWRLSLAIEQCDHLRRLRGKALGVVEDALDRGDVRTALAILRVLATPAVVVPMTVGPSDPNAVLDMMAARLPNGAPPLPGYDAFAWSIVSRDNPGLLRAAAMRHLASVLGADASGPEASQ